jgi:8-oxo-dGTP pyrophosphatase MutT (NUDIX family)
MSEKKKSCGVLVQCGNRYLMVHSTSDWAPFVKNDGRWGFPKGGKKDGEEDRTAAIRELFEETGIDLSTEPKSLEEHALYSGDIKTFVVFKYVDTDMKLMNHKFHCDSYFKDKNDIEMPEIDRYYWATEEEFENLCKDVHKDKLFVKIDESAENDDATELEIVD